MTEKIRSKRNCWNIREGRVKTAGFLFAGDQMERTRQIGKGNAAKVYFNALFGLDFTRTAENPTNAALNYGYSILLSAFAREITSNGYITQLGLFSR